MRSLLQFIDRAFVVAAGREHAFLALEDDRQIGWEARCLPSLRSRD